MGGLLLILPVVAFDLWLSCTTGRRQLAEWRARQNWRHLAAAAAAALLLAVWLAFFVAYSSGAELRVVGFPVPVAFLHLDGKTWTRTTTPGLLHNLGVAANFLTGLAAPFIPFKIAEFFKVVKAELK
jgi:hypothetical protein